MTGEEGGNPPPASSDRFRIYVAIGIVLVSIAGALVSFGASQSAEEASGTAQEAVQERQLQEQGHAFSRFLLSVDLERVGPLLELDLQSSLLSRQANSRRSGDPAVRASLRADADRNRLEAKTLRRYLLNRAALDDKASFYNQTTALHQFEDANAALKGLRPRQTRRAADGASRKTVRLVATAAGLAAALFSLTLAQLTKPPRRRVFAGVGASLAVASGLTALVLVAS